MGKIKQFILDVVEDLYGLAHSIEALAEVVEGNEPAEQPPKTAEGKPELTLEKVRAVLANKSQAGFTAEVKGLLDKYGAPKLSQVDPKNYESLLADAEALQ
jgi:hypothetical protein